MKGEHIHHIIPKHAGGDDSPENRVRLTIEDHAIAHLIRYKIYGDIQDKVAWKGLSGDHSRDELRREVVSHIMTTNNPGRLPHTRAINSERMKTDNPNKGWNNRTAVPCEVEYDDGSLETYTHLKALTEKRGIPYPTVKYMWINGKGSRKHRIKRIRQV